MYFIRFLLLLFLFLSIGFYIHTHTFPYFGIDKSDGKVDDTSMFLPYIFLFLFNILFNKDSIKRLDWTLCACGLTLTIVVVSVYCPTLTIVVVSVYSLTLTIVVVSVYSPTLTFVMVSVAEGNEKR